MTTTPQRRRAPRIPHHGNLMVKVKRHGLFESFRRPEKVTWMDYNRHGMAFESLHKQDVGDELVIDLEMEPERVAGVIGVVRNRRYRFSSSTMRDQSR